MARSTVFLAIVGAAHLSCALPGVACTEIGCVNEVAIAVTDPQGRPATAFHGSIDFPTHTVGVACPAPAGSVVVRCRDNEIVIENANPPDSVRANLESANGVDAFTGDVALERSTFRPNGPGCDPECTTARGTVALQ